MTSSGHTLCKIACPLRVIFMAVCLSTNILLRSQHRLEDKNDSKFSGEVVNLAVLNYSCWFLLTVTKNSTRNQN